MLGLQLVDLVNNRVQAEFLVAGMDIRSVSGGCNLLEQILVQLCDDDVAVPVFQQVTIHRDRLPGCRSDTYRIYFNSRRSDLLRHGHGVILVIFPIRDDNDGTALLALGAETLGGSLDCIPYRRTLDRY